MSQPCLSSLFVDMNSYFASVEQQLHPELRHRPVAVVPTITDSTCCIAASYEAKRFGIKTGTNVGDAKRLCPDLICVEGIHEEYVRMHHAFIASIESCIHVDEIHSIDEVSCRLMGVEQEESRAVEIAHRIKAKLRHDVGEYLRCSIGLGPNRFISKVATDMQKPDGLVVIRKDELPQRLFGLELIDLPGIGRRMLGRLHQRGITTVEQLCTLSEKRLCDVWESVLGKFWWNWLHGHEVYNPPTHRRTVSHSHVLPPNLRNDVDARAVIIRLIHRAAARLRSLGYWARQMFVIVRSISRPSWHDRAHLGLCQDTLTMVEVFSRMWKRRPPGKPFQVGIALSDLVPDDGATRPLFDGEKKRIELSQIMDRLNTRFGTHTIYLAGMHQVNQSAPPRIAFNHIPEMQTALM